MRLSLTPIREQIQSALSKIQEIKKLNDEDPQSRTHDLMHIKFDPSSLNPYLGYLSTCTSGDDFKVLQKLRNIANVGEVVIPTPREQELIKLLSELQSLTEVSPENKVNRDRFERRINNLRNHITREKDSGIVTFPKDDLDAIASRVREGKVIMIDLSELSNDPEWYSTAKNAFYDLSKKLGSEFGTINDGWTIFEALKNAFLHGNDLDFDLPIFLKLSLDDRNKINTMEFYDMAETKDEDVSKELKRMVAQLAQLGGYGQGSRKIKEEWGWNTSFETINDDSNRKTIGKKCVFVRNNTVAL